MAVFNDEDSQTVRSLMMTMGGFALLTFILIVGALLIA